jgi:hypothetical protein
VHTALFICSVEVVYFCRYRFGFLTFLILFSRPVEMTRNAATPTETRYSALRRAGAGMGKSGSP